MTNKIKIKIGGMEYCINSDDDEQYLSDIARSLDKRLDTIAKKSPFLSTTMVAVFAALEAYDKAKKQTMENENMRLELKRALEETSCAKLEADILRRKLAHYEGGGQE